jgi:hypothetical protein
VRGTSRSGHVLIAVLVCLFICSFVCALTTTQRDQMYVFIPANAESASRTRKTVFVRNIVMAKISGIRYTNAHRHRRNPSSTHPKQSPPRLSAVPACLDRGGVDHEAVLHVARHRAVVRGVNLLGRDELDVAEDVVLAAEVQHLLGLADAADQRPGHCYALEDQRRGGQHQRGRRHAYDDELAVVAQ